MTDNVKKNNVIVFDADFKRALNNTKSKNFIIASSVLLKITNDDKKLINDAYVKIRKQWNNKNSKNFIKYLISKFWFKIDKNKIDFSPVKKFFNQFKIDCNNENNCCILERKFKDCFYFDGFNRFISIYSIEALNIFIKEMIFIKNLEFKFLQYKIQFSLLLDDKPQINAVTRRSIYGKSNKIKQTTLEKLGL